MKLFTTKTNKKKNDKCKCCVSSKKEFLDSFWTKTTCIPSFGAKSVVPVKTNQWKQKFMLVYCIELGGFPCRTLTSISVFRFFLTFIRWICWKAGTVPNLFYLEPVFNMVQGYVSASHNVYQSGFSMGIMYHTSFALNCLTSIARICVPITSIAIRNKALTHLQYSKSWQAMKICPLSLSHYLELKRLNLLQATPASS